MFSQNTRHFFDEISFNEARLTTSEKQKVTKKANDKLTKSIKLVKIKKLKDLPNGDLLSLPISGENEPLMAESLKYQYYGDEDFTWIGKLKNKTGYFAFISKPEGGKMGFMQFDNRFFLFQPLNKNICLLIEHDVPKYEKVSCGHDHDAPRTNNNAALETITDPCALPDGTDCPATIDILVLATPQAQQWATANLGFWEQVFYPFFLQLSMELAFINSGIPNKHVRIKMAAFNFTPTANINNDVNNLAIQSQSLRDQYGADMVVMLTNQTYFTPDFRQIFGSVRSPQINVDVSDAFAIVEIPFAFGGRWTFPHEVGHLFGARHNRTSNGGGDDTDVCSHALRFTDGIGIVRRTILAGLDNPQIRELNYSNPDIQINGVATGTADNNNARAIRNTGCITSNYRQSEMSVIVYSDGCLEGQEAFTAYVTPSAIGDIGQAPFQYDWYTSPSLPYNPNNASYIGSGQNMSVNSPSFGYFWIHCKVTSSDGLVKITSNKVHSNCFQEIMVKNKSGNIDKEKDIFEISPNPNQGIFNLEINMTEASAKSVIEMTDLNGKVIQTVQKGEMQQGYHQFKIDLSEQAKGFYFCKIQTGNQFKTLKIVKL